MFGKITLIRPKMATGIAKLKAFQNFPTHAIKLVLFFHDFIIFRRYNITL